MSDPGASEGANPLADALLAAQLFCADPPGFGGMVLRGSGPARDIVLEHIRAHAATRRLPLHVDEERLLGGVDITASLSAGKAVMQSGLLAEARGGILIAPMAERMGNALAGRLAQAMDGAADFGLVLLDDGREADEGPPAALLDRVAFHCDLSRASAPAVDHQPLPVAGAISPGAVATESALAPLAAVAAALGVDSIRALILSMKAAATHAAGHGRDCVAQEDVTAAARLILAPRATRVPDMPPDEAEQAPPPDSGEQAEEAESPSQSGIPDDVILQAALAAIPPDVLDMIAGNTRQRRAQGGGSGKRTKSKLRGKPLGARPGMPRGGARLAVIDTLRAAVPFQPLRRREAAQGGDSASLHIRKGDLRIRRFEERAASVTVFCVDASGSAAAARLAEAKGAVELILAQAYVKRSEVALIAFRGAGAELLLPPTRSLTRARRALSGLPGGGGTPLAAGLNLARELGTSIAARGNTPFLVILTDGSANVAADGTPGRKQAGEDAEKAAKTIAASGLGAVVIDIAPRPRPDARGLAANMGARYLPLPLADAQSLSKVVLAARPESVSA